MMISRRGIRKNSGRAIRQDSSSGIRKNSGKPVCNREFLRIPRRRRSHPTCLMPISQIPKLTLSSSDHERSEFSPMLGGQIAALRFCPTLLVVLPHWAWRPSIKESTEWIVS